MQAAIAVEEPEKGTEEKNSRDVEHAIQRHGNYDFFRRAYLYEPSIYGINTDDMSTKEGTMDGYVKEALETNDETSLILERDDHVTTEL